MNVVKTLFRSSLKQSTMVRMEGNLLFNIRNILSIKCYQKILDMEIGDHSLGN